MAITNGYCTLAELKAALSISDSSDDTDLESAINASSRAIDRFCGRRFWADSGDTTRYFTPLTIKTVMLHGDPEDVDIESATTVTVDIAGDNSFSKTLTEDTHFVLSPRSAAANSRPYRKLVALPGWQWPLYDECVKIAGVFGWSTQPDEVTEACRLIAEDVFKSVREAPQGFVTAFDDVVRLGRSLPPKAVMLLQPYRLYG